MNKEIINQFITKSDSFDNEELKELSKFLGEMTLLVLSRLKKIEYKIELLESKSEETQRILKIMAANYNPVFAMVDSAESEYDEEYDIEFEK